MTSEIRANKQTNRAGLGTVTYADTGIIVSGIVTCTELSGLTALNIAGVGTASTLDINGDIDVDGHTNLDNVSIAGITTFSDDVTFTGASHNVVWDKSQNRLDFDYDALLRFGENTFRIYNDGSGTSFIRNQAINLRITSDIFRVRKNNDSTHYINCQSNRVQLYYGGNEKFRTTSTGITVNGTVIADGADINGDLDADGHTNLDNVSIAGVTTTSSLFNIREAHNTAYSASASPNAFTVGNINSSTATNFTGIHLFTDGNGRGVVNLNALNNSTNASADFTIQTRHSGTLGERLRITSDGYIKVKGDQGNSDYWGKIYNRSDGFSFHAADGSVQRNFTFYSGASTSTERLRITSGGDVLIADTTNTIYDDTSGGGMNLKANGQLVLKKQAVNTADPILWLNDTGQTTNKFILFAQDGNEKASIGLAGNDLRFARDGYNETLRIESGGDVSIGGMDANTFNGYRTFTIGGSGASDGAGIDLERSDGNIYGRFFADANGVQIQSPQSGDYIRFETAGANERLRITDDGTFGVNLTTPKTTKGIHISKGTGNGGIGNSYSLGNEYLHFGYSEHNTSGDMGLFTMGFGYVAGGTPATNSPAYFGYRETSTSGYTNGALVFATRNVTTNTAPTERLRIRSNGQLVVNHTQSSTPLNNTFLSIYDANSDSSALDASGVSKNYAMISLHNYGTGNNGDTTGIGFGAGSGFNYTKGSIAFQRQGSYGTGDLVFLTNNDQDTTMVNDTDEKMRISRQGYVTKPQTPAFFATHTSTSSSHTGTLPYNTSGAGYYNNGGHLNVSTGKFTAPCDGIYHFHFHGFFQTNQGNSDYEVLFRRINANGSGVTSVTRQYGYRDQATNQYGPSISMHYTGPMTTGQTMEVRTSFAFHGANGYYFGGYLIG